MSEESKHNLENAGNVIGQGIGTAKFDAGYKRKKGMRFFFVFLVLVLVCAVVLLFQRHYPGLEIIYAGNDGITVHYIKTNTFGKSRIDIEEFIEYPGNDYNYDGLTGNTARIAEEIARIDAELIVAMPDVLEELVNKNYLTDVTFYVDEEDEDNILTIGKPMVNSTFYINYGARAKGGRYFEWIEDGAYVSVVSPIHRIGDEKEAYMIHDFTYKIVSGEPYRIGKRDYSEGLLDHWKKN